jgi:hypothetical protein
MAGMLYCTIILGQKSASTQSQNMDLFSGSSGTAGTRKFWLRSGAATTLGYQVHRIWDAG